MQPGARPDPVASIVVAKFGCARKRRDAVGIGRGLCLELARDVGLRAFDHARPVPRG